MAISHPNAGAANAVPSKAMLSQLMGFGTQGKSTTQPATNSELADALGDKSDSKGSQSLAQVIRTITHALSIPSLTVDSRGDSEAIEWSPKWKMPTAYKVERRFAADRDSLGDWTELADDLAATEYDPSSLSANPSAGDVVEWRLTPKTAAGIGAPTVYRATAGESLTVAIDQDPGNLKEDERLNLSATVGGTVEGEIHYLWEATNGTFLGELTTVNDDPVLRPDDVSADTDAVIKLTVRRGGKKARAQITVTIQPVASPKPVTIEIQPDMPTVATGGEIDFDARVDGGTGPQIDRGWSAKRGTIETGGHYTAPATKGADEVAFMVDVGDTTYTGKMAVTVEDKALTVAIDQDVELIEEDDHLQLSATVGGLATGTIFYEWTATGGTFTGAAQSVSPTPIFRADNIDAQSDATITCQVTRAGHVAESEISFKIEPVTKVEPVTITLTPRSPTVDPRGTIDFDATVKGGAGPQTNRVWSASRGTITIGGHYTAPSTAGKDAVTFSCKVDGEAHSSTVEVAVAETQKTLTVKMLPRLSAIDEDDSYVMSTILGGSARGTPRYAWTAVRGTFLGRRTSTAAKPRFRPDNVSVNSTGSISVTVTRDNATATASQNVTIKPVLKIAPVRIQMRPSTAKLMLSGTQDFDAIVTGGAGEVTDRTWSAIRGAITVGGHYTAPATDGRDTVKFAVKVGGKSYSAEARVDVASEIVTPQKTLTVRIDQDPRTLREDEALRVTATIKGSARGTTGIVWRASGGTFIGQTVHYGTTAVYRPNNIAQSTLGSIQVTVTRDGLSASFTRHFTIEAVRDVTPVTITLTPTEPTVQRGGEVDFDAVVRGGAGRVTERAWRAGRGKIVVGGHYTAPSTRGRDTITFSCRVGGVPYSSETHVTVA